MVLTTSNLTSVNSLGMSIIVPQIMPIKASLRVIKQSTVLISKAFKGQLVVPEFSTFTQDIVEIYEK